MLTHNRATLIALLTQALTLAEALPDDGATAPAPTTPKAAATPPALDLSAATPIAFRARLEGGEGIHQLKYVGAALVAKGHQGVKGPKGGVYCIANVAIGADRQRAQLKIAAKAYDSLVAGTAVKAWVRFPGESQDRLIGYLHGYEAVQLEAAPAA